MSAKNRWRYASRTIIKTILAVATVELAYDAAIVSVRNVVLSENQTQGFRYWNGDEVPKRFGGESHVAKLRRTLRQLMNGYREVQRIYIRESPSNIDWICFFPEVESIKSNYGLVGYDSLSALRSCKNLKSLWCPFSDVSDLSALRDLKYLSSLNIRGSLVNNLDDLRGLPLQLLDVSQTRLTTLEPLAKINSLEFLRLSGCQISDWKGLASCKTVIELDVSGSNISDADVFASLTSLNELDLAGTRIRDIRPLAQLPLLQRLDIRDTEITDFSALAKIPSLSHVSLEIVGETEEDIAHQLQALARLQLSVPSIAIRIDAPIHRVSGIVELIPKLGTLDLSETFVGEFADTGLTELPSNHQIIFNERATSRSVDTNLRDFIYSRRVFGRKPGNPEFKLRPK